jgi:hypothetical protein
MSRDLEISIATSLCGLRALNLPAALLRLLDVDFCCKGSFVSLGLAEC